MKMLNEGRNVGGLPMVAALPCLGICGGNAFVVKNLIREISLHSFLYTVCLIISWFHFSSKLFNWFKIISAYGYQLSVSFFKNKQQQQQQQHLAPLIPQMNCLVADASVQTTPIVFRKWQTVAMEKHN